MTIIQSPRRQTFYPCFRFILISIVALLILGGKKDAIYAATVNLSAGGNLQAAINNAKPGDTIILEAGATFSGPIILPYKAGSGTDSDFITIQSSALDQLPQNVRVSPAQANLMPKITAPGGNFPALRTEAAAHHYRFLGIEFVPATAEAMVTNLIELGDDGTRGQTSLERVPHHLVLDRCYIHAWAEQDVRRGIALNSAHTEVTNSYLSEFKSHSSDSQAILGWNGPGPFRIINNYLEGATENLQFGGGGGDPAIANLVPSDIEVRRNHLAKPLAWRGKWLVKNLLELKYARRVVIEGNLLEYNWADGQAGYAIQLTVRNEGGRATWNTIEDVEITNNVVRHTSGGINILGRDYNNPSQQAKRIVIRNNLFAEMGSARWGGTDTFLQVTETEGVVVDHNTVFQGGNIIEAYGVANTNFVFTNNIVPHNAYGIFGGGQSPGNKTIAVYFPRGVFKRNVIYGDFHEPEYGNYPPDNFYPDSLAEVGFAGFATGNYRLSARSRYKGKATDGKDIGCDFDALSAATAGVATSKP